MIIIMAQGQGSRWGSGHFKHLIPVPHPAYKDQNISIIGRQIFQCNNIGYTPLVVGWPEILAQVKGEYDFLHLNNPGKTLFDGIRQTKEFWKAKNVILLGDVVFSASVFDATISSSDEMWIVGRAGANPVTGKNASELFSLGFFWSRQNDVLGPWGRLWDLEKSFTSYKFVQVDDWTDDLDSPEEYDQFYKKLVEAARL